MHKSIADGWCASLPLNSHCTALNGNHIETSHVFCVVLINTRFDCAGPDPVPTQGQADFFFLTLLNTLEYAMICSPILDTSFFFYKMPFP